MPAAKVKPLLRRGPRLGTKLMMLGAALLIVPWFSFRQLVQMESFLIQGQSQAQLLTAEGISTLLNGREDLFNDLPISLDGYEALYAHPLPAPVRIDARAADWQPLADKRQTFGIRSSAARLIREGRRHRSFPTAPSSCSSASAAASCTRCSGSTTTTWSGVIPTTCGWTIPTTCGCPMSPVPDATAACRSPCRNPA
ncbi:MAG: hypothetical protein U5R48_07870 [Gammaproteobacteria bacterium]|nr:hypothetical protein [Gammaproteobacteria bacterium]